MVSGLSGFWRPFLRLASSPLITPACRRNLDRRNTVKRAHFLGYLDAGHYRRLRVDHRWVGLQTAAMDPKLHTGSAEGFDVDFRRAGHLLEEA